MLSVRMCKPFGFQSTPPVKAATFGVLDTPTPEDISIHAAREGGDICPRWTITRWHGISIHAAREGGDLLPTPSASRYTLFQSTPPVKAATETSTDKIASLAISIHAAREGGDSEFAKLGLEYRVISIHAAREGGDVP